MLAGFGVPEKRAAIIAGGSKQTPIRTEIHRLDTGSMTSEGAQLILRCNVPNLDGVIGAARREHFAVMAESYFADAATVSFDVCDLPARSDVPELHLAHRFNLQVLHHV